MGSCSKYRNFEQCFEKYHKKYICIFNATKDKGGKCEGNWLNPQSNQKSDFERGIDSKVTAFILVDEANGEVSWDVLEQKKCFKN